MAGPQDRAHPPKVAMKRRAAGAEYEAPARRFAPCRPRPRRTTCAELLDRLHRVRGIGLPAESAAGVHGARLRQFVREGYTADAHQLARYAARRHWAILAALFSTLRPA